MSEDPERMLVAMAVAGTAPVWVPVYIVYLLAVGARSGIKGTYRAGQRLYASYISKEEAERVARELVAKGGGVTEAIVVKADTDPTARVYKFNSAANRVTYNTIMKKPHTNEGLNGNNLAFRNKYQNNLMNSAYPNSHNPPVPAAPAPPAPAPRTWGSWFGRRGGSRSKRSTKRRRNARRSSSRR